MHKCTSSYLHRYRNVCALRSKYFTDDGEPVFSLMPLQQSLAAAVATVFFHFDYKASVASPFHSICCTFKVRSRCKLCSLCSWYYYSFSSFLFLAARCVFCFTPCVYALVYLHIGCIFFPAAFVLLRFVIFALLRADKIYVPRRT